MRFIGHDQDNAYGEKAKSPGISKKSLISSWIVMKMLFYLKSNKLGELLVTLEDKVVFIEVWLTDNGKAQNQY